MRFAGALAVSCLTPLATIGAPSGSATAAAAPVAGYLAPTPLGNVVADPGSSVVFDGRLYFTAVGPSGREVWSSDGTPAGTHEAIDVNPGPAGSNPTNYVVFQHRLLFRASPAATGAEWFTSDGTTGGTHLLHDIYPGSLGSDPGPAVVAGGDLYFAATGPSLGRELWLSDGTDAGTRIANDVVSGPASSSPTDLVALDDDVVYAADDGSALRSPFGTNVITQFTVDLAGRSQDATDDLGPQDFVRVADRVFFAAGSSFEGSKHGRELWSTTGSPEETGEVQDTFPGFLGSTPADLTAFDGRLWYQATVFQDGAELYVSDGTDAGTHLVDDIAPGSPGSKPTNLRVLGDHLLFDADDGVHGTELWSANGSGSDTHLVRDIVAGLESGTARGTDPLVMGLGALSLFTGYDAAGAEPWVTDGTGAGTVPIADLAPGALGSDPQAIGVVGATAIFSATVNGAAELYAWNATRLTGPPGDTTGTMPLHSTTVARAHPAYSALEAHRKRISVRVSVSSTQGAPLTGGTVTLTLRGRAVGRAPLIGGTAKVRITKRLAPRHRYALTASWSGTSTATGSTSAPIHVRIEIKKRKHHR
jgi:ELWxxDGT repeat protein